MCSIPKSKPKHWARNKITRRSHTNHHQTILNAHTHTSHRIASHSHAWPVRVCVCVHVYHIEAILWGIILGGRRPAQPPHRCRATRTDRVCVYLRCPIGQRVSQLFSDRRRCRLERCAATRTTARAQTHGANTAPTHTLIAPSARVSLGGPSNGGSFCLSVRALV